MRNAQGMIAVYPSCRLVSILRILLALFKAFYLVRGERATSPSRSATCRPPHSCNLQPLALNRTNLFPGNMTLFSFSDREAQPLLTPPSSSRNRLGRELTLFDVYGIGLANPPKFVFFAVFVGFISFNGDSLMRTFACFCMPIQKRTILNLLTPGHATRMDATSIFIASACERPMILGS
jgi:hypothetical protein